MNTYKIATTTTNTFDPDKYLLLDLQFFADSGEEKTEKPTAKRKTDARNKGQVAKSQEIATAFLFILGFTVLKQSASDIINTSLSVYDYSFSLIASPTEITSSLHMARLVSFMLGQITVMIMPMLLIAAFVGLATNIAQVGWHPTTKPLKPDFKKIKPKNPLKVFISKKSMMNLVKSLLKIIIISFVFYSDLKNEASHVEMLMDMDLFSALAYIGNIGMNLGIKTGYLMLFVAAIDYAFNRYTHNKSMKMTKHDIKEEFKQSEGDPLVKSKIRSKMHEGHMRRMMSEVPNADVVITNPTHFAVAIKYDKEKAEAPYVSAKGADLLAKRIKDIAKENNIEIVENKQLARALYYTTDINQVIPNDLYQAVAEVLAFVYNIKKR